MDEIIFFDGAKEKHDLDKAKDIATSIRKNLYHLGTCSEKEKALCAKI